MLPHSLLGRWSTSGSDKGIAHFSQAIRNTINGVGGKRTNEQYAWVNSSARKELCNTAFHVCIYRLTQAWVSSKKFYNTTGMPTYLDQISLTGLDPLSCRLVSLLSGVDWSLASPFANCLPRAPLSNSLTGVPFLLLVTRDLESKTLCLVSRQNRQRDRLLGGPPT